MLSKVNVKTPLLEIGIEGQKGDIVPYGKLVKLLVRLDEMDRLVNLNNVETKLLKSGEFVYFNGTATFELNENDSEMVLVKGTVKDSNFVCNCSKKWFAQLSPSFLVTLLDRIIHAQNHKIFFLGNLMERITDPKEILVLSALFIGGSI